MTGPWTDPSVAEWAKKVIDEIEAKLPKLVIDTSLPASGNCLKPIEAIAGNADSAYPCVQLAGHEGTCAPEQVSEPEVKPKAATRNPARPRPTPRPRKAPAAGGAA